jgi:hypothetical protein
MEDDFYSRLLTLTQSRLPNLKNTEGGGVERFKDLWCRQSSVDLELVQLRHEVNEFSPALPPPLASPKTK